MVKAEQEEVVAYIAVGSNIEPEKNVPAAVAMLSREVRVLGVSQFYRTKAVERPEQGDYRNGVVKIATDLGPAELKHGVLRAIETKLGRVRSADRYAARTIDLDVILYRDLVLAQEDLVLPDAAIRTRAFVAVPLLEIAPDLVLPDNGERLAELPVVGRTAGLEPDPALSSLSMERRQP